MIISVEKAKQMIDVSGWTDERLERKLKAIEATIRKYTNNNFQKRAFRKTADIVGSLFVAEELPFLIGDTVQISESGFNEGLYTVTSASDDTFTVAEAVTDEKGVLVTKVEYPEDVIDCALNLLEWDRDFRSKVGIKSESKTLSRHSESVTYEDSASMFNGYPVGILNALNLHRKARF
jgi:hypothetical protein